MEFVLAAVLLVVVAGAIGAATGDLGGGGHRFVDAHYDDDDHSPLTNVSGTPMAGDVDINGNPYGVDDGMSYGLDD